MTRIATFYQNQTTLRNLQQANSSLSLTTYQVTTGQKFQGLSDMGGQANSVLTLNDVQRRMDMYAGNITSAQNTLKASETALQDMADLLSEATALATQARNENSAETRATLAPKAQALTESFYTLMRTQYNGTYLFSGMNGQTSPLSGTAAPAAYPGDPLPTTWYEGDMQASRVVTGPGTTQEYGVTGNNGAFASLKAGLEALWNGLQTNNVSDLDQATVALSTAKGGTTNLLGQVGGQLSALTSVADRFTTQKTFNKEQLAGIEKVDMAEALTTYSQQSATLQASMMIISNASQMSLLNYLK